MILNPSVEKIVNTTYKTQDGVQYDSEYDAKLHECLIYEPVYSAVKTHQQVVRGLSYVGDGTMVQSRHSLVNVLKSLLKFNDIIADVDVAVRGVKIAPTVIDDAVLMNMGVEAWGLGYSGKPSAFNAWLDGIRSGLAISGYAQDYLCGVQKFLVESGNAGRVYMTQTRNIRVDADGCTDTIEFVRNNAVKQAYASVCGISL